MGRVIGEVTYQADDMADFNNAVSAVDTDPKLTIVWKDSATLKIRFDIQV